MKPPLYIVDGSGYIFRAYYAIQSLSTESGFPTNALLGFTRMLLKLLKDKKAEYVAVAFDTGAKTFRHEMYDEYKANRGECPEDLVPQMPYFRKIVEALGIPSMEKEGFEADDVIATVAKKFGVADQKIIIVSGDKDLTQLVNDNILVWDAMRDITFDDWTVKEKFGVGPEQILDFLSLCGDSSDNIPGVKGIGPKTAIGLLENFGSVDSLIENASSISEIKGLRGAKSVQVKVESSVDMLKLSRDLVTLCDTVEPFYSLEKLEDMRWQSPKREALESLFGELEFHSMANTVLEIRSGESVEITMVGDSSVEKGSCEDVYEKKDYTLLDLKNFPVFLKEISKQKSFAFDSETTSLDIFDAKLVGLSFSWKKNQAYYLPVASNVATGDMLIPLEQVVSSLSSIFSDPKIKKIGSNLKFDIHILRSHGINVMGACFDTMLCAHVLQPDKRNYGLKALTKAFLEEEMVTYEEMIAEHESILDVPLETLSNYACHDADASWSLQVFLGKELDKAESRGARPRELLEKIEIPLIESLVKMERAGISVDHDFLNALGLEFSEDIERLKKRIYEIAGVEFNVNSPKQLSEILFVNLEIPTKGVKKTKTGFSTNASVLQKLQGQHEIIDRIMEHRELHKLNSTYVEALPPLIREQTGRIHASFNQAITSTGRLSSSNPNLQNIPVKNPKGRRIRKAFRASEGSVFILSDYSQVELRVLAHISGDETLKQAFIDGEDIHTKTAEELFSDSSASKKELRRIAKTINFGIIYGMSAFRLAKELEISRYEAQAFIDKYFDGYPKVRDYFDRLKADIETKGYVETMFGRRRYLSDLNTAGRDAGYAQRSLLNTPIQGTAAEIIKLAMFSVDNKLQKWSGRAKIVLQVHDELIVEVDKDIQQEVQQAVIQHMQNCIELDVPLLVESRFGVRWGED